MRSTQEILAGPGLPERDAYALPSSSRRFADEGHYRIEIPSCEGPQAMEAVVAAAETHDVAVHRVSQGSGIMLQTAAETERMLAIGRAHGIEVSLFVGPRAAWDVGVLGRMKQAGDLPSDLVLKVSITMPAANPATARILEDLGATSINLPVDLSLPQIAAIRQAIDASIDIYVESPDDFGGAVRYYEIPELVRVAAPIYLKFGVRNAPGLYPSGQHLETTAVALARERVRRAAIGLAILQRSGASAIASPSTAQR